MSRVTYKGLQIEWAPDECAEPLAPKPHSQSRRENSSCQAKKPATAVNRFDLLNLDGTEDDSEEDRLTEHFSSKDSGSAYSREINWAESSMADSSIATT